VIVQDQFAGPFAVVITGPKEGGEGVTVVKLAVE
jgi:hypothetical protein